MAVAAADDFDTANGGGIMDYWQAQDRIRTTGLGARCADGGGKLVNVAEAVDVYERELKTRGGDRGNATRIRLHLPDSLAGKTVAFLVARDFKSWRDVLIKAKLSADTINRVNTCLKACLNLAADQDECIANRRAWEKALATLPDATQSRNIILSEQAVRAVVAGAYKVSREFGLLTEVAACTGARVSQLARLEARDIQPDRARLMMPSSRKGRGRKRIDRHPVPIPAGLAARLAEIARARPDNAPLLVKPSGEPWRKSDHLRLFTRAAKDLELGDGVTFYSLRHSNIARALLASVPIRVVAVNHDTSVAMIERTYSRYIGDHSDTVARRALLDLTETPTANVVALHERAK
jgi:integrase